MGVWDKTSPAGTAPVSEGDDRIRELKDALEEALSHEDSTFPGPTPGATPIYIPGIKKGTTAQRPVTDSLVAGRSYMNDTLAILERYNGSSWDQVAVRFVAGTKMVFYQATAPTGWTAVAVDDKFLRVVTAGGTGGTTGGTTAASSSLAHTHTVDSHTHTGPSHTHTGPNHTHSVPRSGWGETSTTSGGFIVTTTGGGAENIATGDQNTGAAGTGATGASGTEVTGGTSPGTDSQGVAAFARADVIIATKD